MLGWGPPPAKDELEQLAARSPSRLSPQHRVQHGVFLPQHAPAAVRRRSRASPHLQCVRPVAFSAIEGPQFGPTWPDPPAELSRLSAACPYTSAESRHRASAQAGRERRCVHGAHVTVWILPPIRERAEYVAIAPPVDRASRGREGIRARADVSAYFAAVSDLETEPDWLRLLAIRLPSACRVHPPLLSCSAYTPESPETNANLRSVLRPFDRREDEPGHGAPGDEPHLPRRAVAADRERAPCTSGHSCPPTTAQKRRLLSSASATTSTTRSGACCSAALGA